MNPRRLTVLLFVFFLSAELLARVGGGQSYSGSGSSSSSSSSSGSSSYSSSNRGSSSSSSSSPSSSGYASGGGGAPTWFILVIILFVLDALVGGIRNLIRRDAQRTSSVDFKTRRGNGAHPPAMDRLAGFDQLRRRDPNFSQIVFEDFCYSLFARVHQARGNGQLDRYAPYVSDVVRRQLEDARPNGMTEVCDVIVGGMVITRTFCEDGPNATLDVTYDANLTEVIDGVRTSWYVQEHWFFMRRADILSLPPAKSKAEHCPACGAPLSTRSEGSCEHCGRTVQIGTFNWGVNGIVVQSKSGRGPILTSDVEEQGTDLPTVLDPALEHQKLRFQAEHPDFRWVDMVARITEIAIELQDAWTARDWERVRPLETEPLFQIHRYWIDAYSRQKLRNVVADFKVGSIDPVKIAEDPFYDAITVRLAASGRDHTIDIYGNLVAGSPVNLRRWTEYWTLIRTRGTDASPQARVSCPNCGAAVVVGSTGTCSFCSGKLTGGEFGWILSKIEQDEAYAA